MSQPDFTTDPSRQSFVDVAPDSHFPIQNLPYGVFQRNDSGPSHCGVAIGEMVLDLTVLEELELLPSRLKRERLFDKGSLNEFANQTPDVWNAVRADISRMLDSEQPSLRDNQEVRAAALIERSNVTMQLPMEIGDYTDFYSSKEHATNVGSMFRGLENALNPNWLHLPVAYHGRASSIVIDGTPIPRPCGQTMPKGATEPSYTACKALDFELEAGFFIGRGNELSKQIPCRDAEQHIFGMVLVNDWSARDIQRWEYVPLGPFLAKNFATSISPWVVPLAALEPFRCAGPAQDPTPLAYLQSDGERTFDIQLEVGLKTPAAQSHHVICRSNFKYLYWNMSQQLAHHTVTGCNMRPGDLLASGTISGATPDSYGSMLELAWRGEKPISLPNDESRSMLLDGDSLAMTGWAQGDGYRVGFGQVEGTIAPATEA